MELIVLENGTVKVVNSAIYAMKKFQEQMKGEVEKAGFLSEEDVAMIKGNCPEGETDDNRRKKTDMSGIF